MKMGVKNSQTQKKTLLSHPLILLKKKESKKFNLNLNAGQNQNINLKMTQPIITLQKTGNQIILFN